MLFGLKKEEISNIRTILRTYSAIEKVLVFGSRAKGTYRPNSDIDLVLYGDIDLHILSELEIKLEELYLPYFFDIIVFQNIKNDDLVQHIIRCGKELYTKT